MMLEGRIYVCLFGWRQEFSTQYELQALHVAQEVCFFLFNA